jgi:hypothetical protein
MSRDRNSLRMGTQTGTRVCNAPPGETITGTCEIHSVIDGLTGCSSRPQRDRTVKFIHPRLVNRSPAFSKLSY